MTLIWIGIAIVGLTAILLIVFSYYFKDQHGYPIRKEPKISRWKQAHTAAIERQGYQNIFLGQHLFCPAFPGVGYHILSVLPGFLGSEFGLGSGVRVTAGDGSLIVLAREIIHGRYREGYHPNLSTSSVKTHLYGPTPISVTAGLLTELHDKPHHSVAFLGVYGPEVLTMATTAQRLGGHIFVASGNLISQATLFASVRDQLIGQEIFLLPGIKDPKAETQSALLTEDILRLLLIIILVVLAIMRLVNLL